MDAPSKAYILTCTSSRAIHLELVHNMKVPAFIREFKGFIARCGVPDIVSDNFKTFKSIEAKRFMTHNNITQIFILPVAPWVGGFYGRLVKSVKLPLRKTLGKSL